MVGGLNRFSGNDSTAAKICTLPPAHPTGKNSGVPRPFHPSLSTEADSEEIELLAPRPRPSYQIFPALGPRKNLRLQAGGWGSLKPASGGIWILVTSMSIRTFRGQIHLPVVPDLTCDPVGDLASEMPCGRCHTCTASRPCGSSRE